MSARIRLAVVAVLTLAALAACSSDDGGTTPEATGTTPAATGTTPAATEAPGLAAGDVDPGSTATVALGDRPFALHVPAGYRAGESLPLVVGLHGYTSNSSELASYFGLVTASDERGFLLALPDGKTDAAGDQFWNAVEGGGCCDFYRTHVDDVAYLSSVIATVRDAYDVDTVAMVGHSNGGFMSHRFACDRAGEVDAIASLAGPLSYDTSACQPSEPVRVLHIHGDADEVVPYRGSAGNLSGGAEETAAAWAALNGCDATPEQAASVDLEASIDGDETSRTVYGGCDAGGASELWTIAGGRHSPTFSADATPLILDFLLGS